MAKSSPDNDLRHFSLQEFKEQVHVLQRLMAADDPSQISAECARLNHLFQSQVQAMDWDDWPAQQRSLLQSIRVEMHKQLRLLSTDLMFLKAAKQAETLEKRQQDIGDRLTNLEGYCDAMTKLAQEGSAEA